MPKADLLHTAFNAGEFSPRMAARVDFDKYGISLTRCRNMLPTAQGGILRRSGTHYVGSTKSDGAARLIAFEFSDTQAYILEFGNLYIRFYRNLGQIESGGSPYEIVSPYATADLFEIQFTQSADVLYIAHPSYKPRKLTRTGHASWTLSNYTPTADPFTSTDNYPAAVTLHKQRIYWAGTNADPQKIWASKSGDFEDLTTGTADDDAFTFTLFAQNVNRIRWITSHVVMFVGTIGGEWILTSDGPAPTPTDIDISRQTTHGCANLRAIPVNNAILFVQRQGKRVHELVYNFERDGYVAPNLNLLADHIIGNNSSGTTIVDLAFQDSPHSVLWCVRSDGKLAALTYRREEDVIAWSIHTIGGTFSGGDAVVESVAVIPGNDAIGTGERDEVWLVVKRTINGSTVRFVEYLEQDFEGPVEEDYDTRSAWRTAVRDAQVDAFYVDAGATYDGAATTTITGLSFLEGETVQILADGGPHPEQTVSSGQITLDFEASKVHVGLGSTVEIKTPKVNSGNPAGAGLGQTKRFNQVTLLLLDSGAFDIGPTADKLLTIEKREVGDPMDLAPPLFSGEHKMQFEGDWRTDPRIVIRSSTPSPFHLLGMVFQQDLNRL